jgi:hypothetical protein
MEPVSKVTTHAPAAVAANPVKTPVVYTTSEIKYGLWHAESCTKNGQPNSAGETLLRMFVLNGDSGKSLEAAQAVMQASKDILDGSKFVLIASKPVTDDTGVIQETAQRIRHSLTGAEIKARAAALVAAAATEKDPEILFKSDKVRQPASKKNLAAGLVS